MGLKQMGGKHFIKYFGLPFQFAKIFKKDRRGNAAGSGR